MNFYEKSIKFLTGMGMFESHAKQVVDPLTSAPDFLVGFDRWLDSTDHYPEQLVNMVLNNLKPEALKWVDANLPLAFYRPMLLPNDELKSYLTEMNRHDLAKLLDDDDDGIINIEGKAIN